MRIIQEAPEEPAEFDSWVNETEWADGRPLPELVINLVLTEETQAEAVEAIRSWVAPDAEDSRERGCVKRSPFRFYLCVKPI